MEDEPVLPHFGQANRFFRRYLLMNLKNQSNYLILKRGLERFSKLGSSCEIIFLNPSMVFYATDIITINDVLNANHGQM